MKSPNASPDANPTAITHARSRRDFVRDVAAGAALLATIPLLEACGATAPAKNVYPAQSVAERLGGQMDLPPLPWAPDALAPFISAETVSIHHDRHHAGYAKKLASLLGAVPALTFRASTLEGLINETRGSSVHAGIYNSAGQLANHNLYWQSLTPRKTAPNADLMALVTRDFGGMDGLKAALKAAALSQFGSGWAWLAARDGGLTVLATADADDPTPAGARALLTVDVWEHAYYVDYRNDRGAHVDAVLDNLLNWDTASERLRS